jgi:hypothetical protein
LTLVPSAPISFGQSLVPVAESTDRWTGQRFVNKDVSIGEFIPGARRRPCQKPDGCPVSCAGAINYGMGMIACSATAGSSTKIAFDLH